MGVGGSELSSSRRPALAMIVGADLAPLARCLESVAGLVGECHVLTSHDAGAIGQVIVQQLGPIGERRQPVRRVVAEPWSGYGPARTRALQLAGEGSAEWVLMLDADMTVEWHPKLTRWLARDPVPSALAFSVDVLDHGIGYRLPLLTRRSAALAYVGAAHEYLTGAGEPQQLTGLVVTHHGDGAERADKSRRDLELLAEDLELGDPRATYYSAQAYRDLGETALAIELYRRRAAMGGWAEESWHAEYQAAKLAGDVDGLLLAYRRRPWRHEPLTAAARLVREHADRTGDRLFIEL